MCIRTVTDQSLLWDQSSTSSHTTHQDDDVLSINSNSSNSTNGSVQPPPPINPYTPMPQPTTFTWLMTTLQLWIITPIVPQPLPLDPTQILPLNPPNKILVPPTEPTHQPVHHQTLLECDNTNQHWGDLMQCPKPFNMFWVLSRNVNTMSNKTNYLSWKAAAHAIATSEADAVTLQETNLAWTKIHCRRVQQILQQPTGNAVIATSSSAEISISPHQRGGLSRQL